MRRGAFGGGGGSKRRASAPAGHHQTAELAALTPKLEPPALSPSDYGGGMAAHASEAEAQPMDCAPLQPGSAHRSSSPWGQQPPQQPQPHLLLIAAAGRQPTPPVTPAAVEGLSPARSPILSVSSGGFCTPPRVGGAAGGGGGGGSLIPGIDAGADWPLGNGWGQLRSLRTGGGGGQGLFGSGGGAGPLIGLPTPSASPAATGPGRRDPGTPGQEQRAAAPASRRGNPAALGALLPHPVPRHGWQGSGGADVATPNTAALGGKGAAAEEVPTAPAESSPPGTARGGSTALTAANIEWLRHADPVEVLSWGLPE